MTKGKSVETARRGGESAQYQNGGTTKGSVKNKGKPSQTGIRGHQGDCINDEQENGGDMRRVGDYVCNGEMKKIKNGSFKT